MKPRAVRHVFTVLALMLVACESNVSEKPLVEKPGRAIKRIMETTHDAQDNEGTLSVAAETSMHSAIIRSVFDRTGNLISKQIFDHKGVPQWRLVYKYDAHGNTVEAWVYQFSDALLSKRINKFDSSDKLKESVVFDGYDQLANKVVIQPEVNGGQFITSFSPTRTGFTKTMECTLNAEGDTLEFTQFNNRALVRKVIHQYENGNRIETREDKPLEREHSITHFKYDDQHKLREQVMLDGSLLIISKDKFAYDDKNNLAEVRTYGIMGSLVDLVSYTYEYDKESNWTKRITYQNKAPVTATLRQIEYY